jgi:hypothetical protein
VNYYNIRHSVNRFRSNCFHVITGNFLRVPSSYCGFRRRLLEDTVPAEIKK